MVFVVVGFDAFGEVLQPAGAAQPGPGGQLGGMAAMSTGNTPAHKPPQSTNLFTGDLESSLASLADNLTIKSNAPSK